MTLAGASAQLDRVRTAEGDLRSAGRVRDLTYVIEEPSPALAVRDADIVPRSPASEAEPRPDALRRPHPGVACPAWLAAGRGRSACPARRAVRRRGWWERGSPGSPSSLS